MKRFRVITGYVPKKERESLKKMDESYAKEGWPEPAQYDMFISFVYDDKKHTLKLNGHSSNSRVVYNSLYNHRLSRDLEFQNNEFIREALMAMGFKPEDPYQLYKSDWFLGNDFEMPEIRDKEEALSEVKRFLDKFYPSHRDIKVEESTEYQEKYFSTFLKYRPYVDKTPRFGFYENLLESEFGVRTDYYQGKLFIMFWHWGVWFRYAPTKFNKNEKNSHPRYEFRGLHREIEKHEMKMPDNISERP